ncbi:MAG: 6-phosphofructokinase [Bacteroidia bacterium]|nr:6-phosphofructokinase [Bacteroidia bacterium]
MRNIIDALTYMNIDTLISIGGDDTLKTANFFKIMGLNVIHIPKTIDNDYFGIPWTFGFWTCVNIAKSIIINLEADALSTDAFVIAELMGRKSGWITYATGIAGESIKMLSTEDIEEDVLDLQKIADEITDLIQLRQKMKRPYGVICVAEGLVEKLPKDMQPKTVDMHGNIKLDKAQIGLIISDLVAETYKKRTGKEIKLVNKQIGYETRAAEPISYDVVLGSMLGYGAYKLYSKDQFGHMVSVTDDFEIKGIPFQELIDPVSLHTKVRFVPRGSDLHTLKEILSYRDFEKR